MIGFYVQGGGLGHLSRIHKLIQYLELAPEKVLIISPSIFTKHFPQYCFVSISWNLSNEELSAKVKEFISSNKLSKLYIDAFPVGIKGELLPIFKNHPSLDFHYISRILKWEKYQALLPEKCLVNFKETYLLEAVYPTHKVWVNKVSDKVTNVDLSIINSKIKHERLFKDPYVLLVHSGGKQDVLSLYKRVLSMVPKDTLIAIFTQVAISIPYSRVKIYKNVYPVANYFNEAERIYTAGGFNLIQELKEYRNKHTAFAIDRHFDDQFFRIRHISFTNK